MQGVHIKIFKLLLFIVAMVVGVFYYLLHTDSGHVRISTYLSSKLSKEFGQKLDIKIQEISLSLQHLDALILVNEKANVKIEGFLGLDGRYDVDYHLVDIAKKDIDLKGKFSGKKDDFHLDGKGHLMEGLADFSFTHDTKGDRDILLQLDKVRLDKVLLFLNQKPLFTGKITVDANVPLFSRYVKKGKIHFETQRGGLYLREAKKFSGVQFPNDFMFSSSGNVLLLDAKHHFTAKIVSNAGKIDLVEGVFNETNVQMDALYHLDIDDLAKLSFLTGKIYRGHFVSKGRMAYHDTLFFDGKSHSLSGVLDYVYKNATLDASLKGLSLQKFFGTLGYPAFMLGSVDGKVSYDVKDKIALINIESKNAHFPESKVLRIIHTASGVDLAKEVFTRTYLSASFDEGILAYNFKAKNKGGYVFLKDAKMDARKNTIDTKFEVQLQDEEYFGKIYGSLKSPRIKLDIARYMEYKASKEIDEFFGIGTSNKVKKKIRGVDKDQIKGFFRELF